jgi:hypothetical protein
VGLDEVCFGVAGVLGHCAKDFMDVFLFFMASAAAEIQRLYPAPKVHFDVVQRNVTFWEVLPEVDYEEVREEHTYDGV